MNLSFTVSLSLGAGLAQAGDRGFVTIAGGGYVLHQNVEKSGFKLRRGRSVTRSDQRDYRVIAHIDADDLIEQNTRSFENSSLRNKVSYSPRRAASKILHVSDEMKRIGEERAARREARMLENIDSIKFGYYRKNEAYDVRYPSIVYLDKLRK